MKNIVLLLPTCATNTINLGETTTTKLMLTTWKKNTFSLLPTCAIATVASSFFV